MSKSPIIKMKGQITVAYRREGTKILSTALQFDLVGIGRTKQEAFKELRKIVKSYLLEVIKSDTPVEFFNPSDHKEWNARDIEYYDVEVKIKKTRPLPKAKPDIRQLKPYQKQIRSFDLSPVSVLF